MAYSEAYEMRSDAAVLVLTARASLHLDVPFMDALLGPNGRHDIIANIDGTVRETCCSEKNNRSSFLTWISLGCPAAARRCGNGRGEARA